MMAERCLCVRLLVWTPCHTCLSSICLSSAMITGVTSSRLSLKAALTLIVNAEYFSDCSSLAITASVAVCRTIDGSLCQTMIVISTYLLSQSLYLILNLCILSTLQIHQFMLVYKTLPHMQGHNIIQFVIVWIVRTVFYTVIYTVQMTCDTYSECHHLSQSCLDVFTPMLMLLTSKFLVNIWLSFSLCRHLSSLLQVQSKCNYPSDFPVHNVVKM